jgi:hypothetical protein
MQCSSLLRTLDRPDEATPTYGESLVLAMRALETLNGSALTGGSDQGPTAPGDCGSGKIYVEIKLATDDTQLMTPDDYASETYLALTSSDGTAVVSGSGLDNDKSYAARRSVSSSDCYTFTTDLEGDGICCGYS